MGKTDVFMDLIKALGRGTAKSPKAWYNIGTYAGLMFDGTNTAQRKAVQEWLDDLLTLGVAVGQSQGQHTKYSYFLIRSHEDFEAALNKDDPRLSNIDLLDWWLDVKKKLKEV